MPVVINEFEVIADPPPAAQRPAPASAGTQAEPLDAAQLQQLLDELHEQALRLHAH